MYNDGLTPSQRYYRRNKEILSKKRSEKYKNNPEIRARVKLQYNTWRKEHPYEFAMMQKRYKQKVKLQRKMQENENVN